MNLYYYNLKCFVGHMIQVKGVVCGKSYSEAMSFLEQYYEIVEVSQFYVVDDGSELPIYEIESEVAVDD